MLIDMLLAKENISGMVSKVMSNEAISAFEEWAVGELAD